jgi:hypothetical protein
VPGWFGTKCDEFAIRFEPANGQSIRVAESDGFPEENGELTFALRESPGANNPVTFQFATTLPNEVAIEPAEVTFSSDDFATPRAIRVRAVKDAFKDGNRTLLIAPTVVSGTGRFSVANVQPTVRATTLDAFPSIAAVSPTVVPLAGRVNATIAGNNWDDWVEVWFESVLVGEFRVARIISNSTGATANIRSHHGQHQQQQLRQTELNTLATTPDTTRIYPPSSDGAVIVPVNKTNLKDAPGGYHTVTIVNVFANTRHTDGTMLYATEDCPFPGEFGLGKDCEPCPDGATCPGGYRIWPLEGYWNPGEGSGWVGLRFFIFLFLLFDEKLDKTNLCTHTNTKPTTTFLPPLPSQLRRKMLAARGLPRHARLAVLARVRGLYVRQVQPRFLQVRGHLPTMPAADLDSNLHHRRRCGVALVCPLRCRGA